VNISKRPCLILPAKTAILLRLGMPHKLLSPDSKQVHLLNSTFNNIICPTNRFVNLTSHFFMLFSGGRCTVRTYENHTAQKNTCVFIKIRYNNHRLKWRFGSEPRADKRTHVGAQRRAHHFIAQAYPVGLEGRCPTRTCIKQHERIKSRKLLQRADKLLYKAQQRPEIG
jgi:hypothetical protein